MLKRLRPAYTPEELTQVYSAPHDSSHWEDHNIRVAKSIEFINRNANEVVAAADLSCGDGRILSGANATKKYYGDFAPGYQFTGPIDATIDKIDKVDLFICSETLEHLDSPITTMSLVREKTRELFVSTPLARFDDNNPEHYWAWDYEGIEWVLNQADFEVVDSEVLWLGKEYYYDFQLVYCV